MALVLAVRRVPLRGLSFLLRVQRRALLVALATVEFSAAWLVLVQVRLLVVRLHSAA
ncbi:hypothetical protein AB395_00005165 (plasmid) [Sinorhizobium fredii CCBAU 45436]|nr:hypothetical protein AB395_00005165 [Sinorhizobium fredii CCBAU 45436]